MLWVYGHSGGIDFSRQNLTSSESDVYRRQTLTTKVDPPTIRAKIAHSGAVKSKIVHFFLQL